MNQWVALFSVGMVAFVYTYSRLARSAWPPGHPWSGLAWLLLSAGIFLGGDPAKGGQSIISGGYFVMGILYAILWLFGTPSKPRGK